jgi:hypothetical protein
MNLDPPRHFRRLADRMMGELNVSDTDSAFFFATGQLIKTFTYIPTFKSLREHVIKSPPLPIFTVVWWSRSCLKRSSTGILIGNRLKARDQLRSSLPPGLADMDGSAQRAHPTVLGAYERFVPVRQLARPPRNLSFGSLCFWTSKPYVSRNVINVSV